MIHSAPPNPDFARALRDFLDRENRNPTNAELARTSGTGRNNIGRALDNLEASGNLDRTTNPWTLPPHTRDLLRILEGQPGQSAPPLAQNLRMIPLCKIEPNPHNPRKSFDVEKLDALADNIAAQGLLQPILVRPVKHGFQLVAGERRWRAFWRGEDRGLPGFTRDRLIPCHVREMSETESIAAAITENLDREGVAPLEEAEGFAAWLDARTEETGKPASARDLADVLGKSVRHVQQYVSIARNASDALKKAMTEERITYNQARAIVGHDHGVQNAIAAAATQKGRLTLPAEAINEHLRAQSVPVERAVFPLEDYAGPFLRSGGKPTHFYDMALFMDCQRIELARREEAENWRRVDDLDAVEGFLPTKTGNPSNVWFYTFNELNGQIERGAFRPAPQKPEPQTDLEEFCPADTHDQAAANNPERVLCEPPGEREQEKTNPAPDPSPNGPARSARPDKNTTQSIDQKVWFDALDAGEKAFLNTMTDEPDEMQLDGAKRAFNQIASAISNALQAGGVAFTSAEKEILK